MQSVVAQVSRARTCPASIEVQILAKVSIRVVPSELRKGGQPKPRAWDFCRFASCAAVPVFGSAKNKLGMALAASRRSTFTGDDSRTRWRFAVATSGAESVSSL